MKFTEQKVNDTKHSKAEVLSASHLYAFSDSKFSCPCGRSHGEQRCRYMFVYDTKPWLMKPWVIFVWFSVAILVVLMELRILLGFTVGK
jgi:hypothetical protein